MQGRGTYHFKTVFYQCQAKYNHFMRFSNVAPSFNLKIKLGTCEQALCECDRQFALAHEAVTDVFNEDYHLFWTKTGWNPEGQCLRGGSGDSDPQC